MISRGQLALRQTNRIKRRQQWVMLDARSWHRMRDFDWLRCLLTVVL